MNKPYVLTLAILLTITAELAQAQEKKLNVTLDVSYLSRWLIKGALGYGHQGAVFETVDLDMYGTGFGIKVTHRSATGSGFANKQRFDYRPYYKNTIYQGLPYATNYNISVGYEHYYADARTKANTTYEWIFDFAWPNLMANGIVPRYTVHYEHPESGGNANRKVAGWVHRFRIGYDIPTIQLPNPIHLTSEVAYYDRLADVGSEWAYANIGLSTKLPVTKNLAFVPAIYNQISMEDNVNKNKNVLYTVLTMKYKF